MMGWYVVLALAAIVVMVASSANCVQTSITCPEAIDTIMPCKPFLVDGEDNPTPMCCKGLKRVKDMWSTKPDRQLLCECFKQTGPPAMGLILRKLRLFLDSVKLNFHSLSSSISIARRLHIKLGDIHIFMKKLGLFSVCAGRKGSNGAAFLLARQALLSKNDLIWRRHTR
ncbi:hypothetical protein QYF36_005252 [Acer negundo]|nr:hypothetical protein QYF36_005252 [Acer negundo]